MQWNLLSWLRGSESASVRRWVALLSVACFVVFGVLHASHHADALTQSNAVQSVSAADDLAVPDAAGVTEGTHCHGCSSVDFPQPAEVIVVVAAGIRLLPRPPDLAHPVAPARDTPPPKRLT